MAAGALLLAERLWLVQPEGFTAFYQRLTDRRALRRLALGFGMVVLALVAVPLMVTVGEDEDAQLAADQPVRTLDTEHFRFSYHPAHEVQAHFIGREADQAYRRLRERLGAPAVEHIVADLTETSDDHLGIAGWKKMRLDIRPPKSEGLLRHLLYHETTHVLAAAVGDGISGARDAEARFFAEGLAEWVTYQLLGPTAAGGPRRDDARRVAGLAHGRFRLRFQDLLDPEDFVGPPRRVPAVRPGRGLGGGAGRDLRGRQPGEGAAGVRGGCPAAAARGRAVAQHACRPPAATWIGWSAATSRGCARPRPTPPPSPSPPAAWSASATASCCFN